MEIFFTILIGVEILMILGLNVFIVKKVMGLETDVRCREHNHEKIMSSLGQLNRSLLTRDNLDNTKPMKTNNWDSVRNCFKGPTRVEVNERN
jgi:hypothetical protein